MKISALVKKAILEPSKIPLAVKIEFLTTLVLLRFRFPTHIFRFFGGMGDDLLCTTVAHELKRRNTETKIWMLTEYPALFLYNRDINLTIDYKDKWYLWYSPMLRKYQYDLAYTKERYFGANLAHDISPAEHILPIMCRKAGISGEIILKPYIFLTEDEKKRGRYGEKQLVIQCIDQVSGSAMLNKIWYTDRFQNVINTISSWDTKYTIIQIGNSKDSYINGTIDLRGKTSLRESAAILSQSACFLGTVGFLMHLARAVDCRSVIIYGGREHSRQSGYSCNVNLESYIECAPCWRWNECNYNKRCMDAITAGQVIEAIHSILIKQNTPIENEIKNI